MFSRSGDRPPWQQKILLSMIAAIGRQLKQSGKIFFIEHFIFIAKKLFDQI
jgi:phage terminase large subunit-like protein